MPSPISAASGPTTSSQVQATEIGPPPPPSAAVALEPVYLEAAPSTRQLVAQHDKQAARQDCTLQTRDATTSSIALVGGTLATAATIATGGTALLVAGCIVGLFGLSIDAGAKLHDLKECKKP